MARTSLLLGVALILSLATGTLAQDSRARAPAVPERAAPMPTRADAKGPYTHDECVCRTCVAAGMQTKVEGSSDPLPLGRDLLVFEPWLTHLAGKKPVIITTRRALLVSTIEPRKVEGLSED